MSRVPERVPVGSTIHCVLDSVETGLLRGWAFDRRSPHIPALFYVIVDGQQVAEIVCDRSREDVAEAGLAPELVGFEHQLAFPLLDGETHRIEFRDKLRRLVAMRVKDREAASCDFAYRWRPKFRSFIDGLRGGAFEGWVLRSQYDSDKMAGDCMVKVTCEGVTVGHIRANRYRSDVAKMFAADAYCGFQFIPPPWVRKPHAQSFRFFVMPGEEELQNSPIVTSLVSNQHESLVLELSDAIDSMHVELTRLRRRMKDLLPAPVFTLPTYDPWYREYRPALREAVAARHSDTRATPLVSVVCPVYRPDLPNFEAAVKSVREQTYQNWELLLVDDGSRDPALTAAIRRLADADRRIRPLPQRRNGGISAATNAGLDAAKGEWVAFFDHDDLLADVALEVMVAAAQDSGGQLLYSDEDKIDPSGEFTDPAFKPAWNYRLLLEVNYICHLLFVAAPLLRTVGPLDTKMNGAQDHDLIFRLTERLRPEQIVHVPEVLYHWRRSETSTASDVSAKPYAIDAGVAAVTEHLTRVGRNAKVLSREGTTSYRIEWALFETPSVAIIIPYKDEIETTRKCVETILSTTAYENYRIILIDNWSTSEAADRFAARMDKTKRVSVMRVEEDFNYSRLNNMAAATTNADFLVFMNNDLFVENDRWLHTLLGEALVDDHVGIVGGKFVYPNRTVQHAGVILGVGGVACHMGTGLGEADPGYCRRVEFAQEYSAVTAAGLLIRAAVFKEIGGFDEESLKVAFNDVDLCLRVRKAGFKVIWTPDFVAEHHESLSRGDDIRPQQEKRFFHEMQTMIERWGDTLTNDPFYNPNLSMDRQAFFELASPATAARHRPYRAGTPGPKPRTMPAVADETLERVE